MARKRKEFDPTNEESPINALSLATGIRKPKKKTEKLPKVKPMKLHLPKPKKPKKV